MALKFNAKDTGDNVYIWRVADPRREKLRGVPVDGPIVNLDPKSTEYDPPSRRLLHLHAAVCRVKRISGRGEKFESAWQDFGSRRVLNTDGTSSDLLKIVIRLAELRQVPWDEEEDKGEKGSHPSMTDALIRRG